MHVLSSRQLDLYLKGSTGVQLPYCFPSHTATVSVPFSHVTVGRGDPLTVQKNLALESSITARGELSWAVAGKGSGKRFNRLGQQEGSKTN